MVLRVQICNERFISRFGVDRLLLLLAAHVEKQGAMVEYSCLRFEPTLFADPRCISPVPIPFGLDMQQTEAHATSWVFGRWLSEKPDVVVCGGWPFFDLAARAPSVGVRSIFIDAGAVPHDGFPSHLLPIQQELRRIRAQTLPYIDRILPISEFIRLSQTELDRCSNEGVRTVHLGADHLLAVLPANRESGILSKLLEIKKSGKSIVLLLGRFEDFGYKNSSRVFNVIKRAMSGFPNIQLLILGKPGEVHIPLTLAGSVTLIGNPTDGELLELMRMTDLAVSMSLWEGFNLPLVEAQVAGCPVLAFNLAAHPEVIADPWFLCEDDEEMAAKAIRILGKAKKDKPLLDRVQAFKGRLPWNLTLSRYWDEVTSLVGTSRSGGQVSSGRRMVLVDVTNSARDTGNSGVVRVARQLSAVLIKHELLDVICVRWEPERQAFALVSDGVGLLGSFGGPYDPTGHFVGDIDTVVAVDRLLISRSPHCAAPPLMMFPEVALDGSAEARFVWAKRNGLVTASILFDLIPVYHAQYCSEDVVTHYKSYIATTLRMDAMLAISETSRSDFLRYAEETGTKITKHCRTEHLPAQLGQLCRSVSGKDAPAGEVRILCVSTLEPRKNHQKLLEAFESLVSRRPDKKFQLRLVGNLYAGRPEIPAMIKAAEHRGVTVEWLGVISDEQMRAEYEAAHFSVYPSLFEGYGMPIVESLWMGRPCLCSENGVMGELARDGGCLTTDVTSVEKLERALEQLCDDSELYDRLTKEALVRPLDDWRSYGDKIAKFIYNLHNLDRASI
jgi:glycosyltransferase involved in cell wall biosynthesis